MKVDAYVKLLIIRRVARLIAPILEGAHVAVDFVELCGGHGCGSVVLLFLRVEVGGLGCVRSIV